jgi:hypothetical protein
MFDTHIGNPITDKAANSDEDLEIDFSPRQKEKEIVTYDKDLNWDNIGNPAKTEVITVYEGNDPREIEKHVKITSIRGTYIPGDYAIVKKIVNIKKKNESAPKELKPEEYYKIKENDSDNSHEAFCYYGPIFKEYLDAIYTMLKEEKHNKNLCSILSKCNKKFLEERKENHEKMFKQFFPNGEDNASSEDKKRYINHLREQGTSNPAYRISPTQVKFYGYVKMENEVLKNKLEPERSRFSNNKVLKTIIENFYEEHGIDYKYFHYC